MLINLRDNILNWLIEKALNYTYLYSYNIYKVLWDLDETEVKIYLNEIKKIKKSLDK